MKILQITNSFYPVIGGQEKVVLELSKGLVKNGHDITVLTSDYMCEENQCKENNINGINIVRLKNRYWLAGYGYASGMISWLKENYNKYVKPQNP